MPSNTLTHRRGGIGAILYVLHLREMMQHTMELKIRFHAEKERYEKMSRKNILTIQENVYDLTPETEMKIIKVLRFLREFMHVSANDLSLVMGEGYSRSLISAVEAGKRNPSAEFIEKYADALQEKLKLKKNVLIIVMNCIEDPGLMNLLDEYEQGDGGFMTTYKISKKLLSFDK